MGCDNEWNNFFLNQQSQAGIFLQSDEWANFLEGAGQQVLRFSFDEFRVLVVQKSLPFGLLYWYVPRASYDQRVIDGLIKKARAAGVVFLRLEPHGKVDFEKGQRVKSVQPHQTRMIDVTLSDDDLLAQMHSKTRYNIRLSRKKGVEVEFDRDGTYSDDFIRLVQVTSSRNDFGIHHEAYYRKQIEQDPAFLVVAKFENNIIATHLYWVFGDTVTYLHGASGNEHRNVMAPHAIHFALMQWAREQGLRWYDLWGIDEKKWEALTRFKRGFGGEDVSYVGCYDIPLRKALYHSYRLAQRMRS